MPNSPISATLDAGTHHICRCGGSANQPFCNGAHKGTLYTPVAVTVEQSACVYVCRCGETHTPPYCDGSHKQN